MEPSAKRQKVVEKTPDTIQQKGSVAESRQSSFSRALEYSFSEAVKFNGHVVKQQNQILALAEMGYKIAQQVAAVESITDEYTLDVELLKSLANDGDANAQWLLGVCFLEGYGGLSENVSESLKWFRLAAERGHCESQNGLAELYRENENEVEALKWFRLAAEQGDVPSQHMVGLYHENGNAGLDVDVVEALKWYRLAATQSDVDSQIRIGVIYNDGVGGIPADLIEAFRWFLLAAQQGHVESQVEVGNFYKLGLGIQEDIFEAFKWFLVAANEDNPEAQYQVGSAFQTGLGVDKDDQKALFWYRRATESGHCGAQFKVGCFYEKGIGGLEVDLQEALTWCQRSGEQGYTRAQVEVGSIYYECDDLVEAESWFRRSTEAGNLVGQALLGSLLCDTNNRDICDQEEGSHFLWEVACAEGEIVDADMDADGIIVNVKEYAAEKYWKVGFPSLQVLSGRAVLMNKTDTSDLPECVLQILDDIGVVMKLGGVQLS